MLVFDCKKVLLLLVPIFGYCNCLELPTPTEFLSYLFNVTVDAVDEVVKQFVFVNVSTNNVKFLLYQSDGGMVTINSQNATNSLEASYPTIIIIHGWESSGTKDWVKEIASLYHQKGVCNVIAVDWSIDANKNYLHAAAVVQSVGNIVGGFILDIVHQIKNFLNTLHLIGHSLGAHVSGFAGKFTQGLINRTTALDAAGPLFELPLPRTADLRLDKMDSKFVDLMHTDKGFLGVFESYGHIDFYVNNGGPIQSNCSDVNVINAIICSHQSSHVYYSQTILNSDKYEGVACMDAESHDLGLCNKNKKNVMGDAVNRNASGTFYVNTE